MWRSGPYFGNARPGWDSRITKEQIYSEIDHWAFHGISGIKVKEITPEHLDYVLSRAHSHGLTVTGHLDSGYNNTVSSDLAIKMGIDRVEHILGGYALDPSKDAYVVWNHLKTTSEDFKKTVRQFISNSVYFNATMGAPVYFSQTELKEGFEYWVDERTFLTPYAQRLLPDMQSRNKNELMDELYLAMRRTTKAFYDAGGGHLITLGTDTTSHGDFLGGFSAHREMHTMVLAGIPAESVLKIATINGARALRKGELIGSIDVGKLADLVVVQGNPLHDITNTRNTRLIIKSGTIYKSEELFAFVDGKIGPQDSGEVADWFKYQELLD
jgi:imidazolonepropionase-like amidohydrolase